MPRKPTKPSIPPNLQHAIGEFLPGFILFGIDPNSGEPIFLSEIPNSTVALALNTLIRHCSDRMEEEMKRAEPFRSMRNGIAAQFAKESSVQGLTAVVGKLCHIFRCDIQSRLQRSVSFLRWHGN